VASHPRGPWSKKKKEGVAGKGKIRTVASEGLSTTTQKEVKLGGGETVKTQKTGEGRDGFR